MRVTNYVIGITGGSASGKTEFLKKIFKCFGPDEVCLISQDNYYRPHDLLEPDEAGYYNHDLPETIDSSTFGNHLEQLKLNQSVEFYEYDFTTMSSSDQLKKLEPAPVIIAEGIFAFHYPEVVKHLDLKLYVEADGHLMLKRRLLRDQSERGQDMNEIFHRFEKHVIPAYEKYILPHKKTADIVVPNYERFDEAFEVVAAFIRSKLP